MNNLRTNVRADFDQWWASYPRKVGKLAALREYERARRHASAEELLTGVGRYLRSKPDYADWCHPRTWLHQGRWMDEEAPLPARQRGQSAAPDQHVTPAERSRAQQVWVSWGRRCKHTPECHDSKRCVDLIVEMLRKKVAS